MNKTIEIMAEETIDKIGNIERDGKKNCYYIT